MILEYTRQCDECKKFVPCEMTYFTERMWFCDECGKKTAGPNKTATTLGSQMKADYLMLVQNLMLNPRQTGRTINIVAAVKATNGILVCHTISFAKKMELAHRIKAVALSQLSTLSNTSLPVFFDHMAIADLIGGAADEILKLTEDRNKK